MRNFESRKYMRDTNPHEIKPTRIQGTSKSMNAKQNNMLSLDNHDMNYKLKTSGGFDTIMSEAETLRLDDIEKIKFDLLEEKSNIRYQEDKLNMLVRKFKTQEEKIDEEKRFIQKRKDELVIQERSLLEEKKRFNELAEKFKEEKRSYDMQKEAIVSQIDSVRQNIIVTKSKNVIHEKKISEYMKKIMELNKRKDYVSSMYSAALNASIDGIEHPSFQKRPDQIYHNETFHTKPNHDRKSSLTYAENFAAPNNQIAEPKRMGYNDNVLVQIRAEEENIDLMEKELENLKALEEQLVKQVIEREKKRIGVGSSTSSPFSNDYNNIGSTGYPQNYENAYNNPSQARAFMYSEKRQGASNVKSQNY